MTKARKITDADRRALQHVRTRIDWLRKDTEARFPEYKSSEWQFLYTVADDFVSPSRIGRLVELGLIESKPSDGHGPSIRVLTTNYQ